VKAVRKGELALEPGNYLAVRVVKPISIEPPAPVERNIVKVGPSLQAKPGARGPRKPKGPVPTGGE
jgi:hypothetical protein